MSGYELLKQVRANKRLAKTPFIIVTPESKAENVIAANNGGASYIVRPFNAQTLRHKINAVFAAAPTPPLAA